MDVSQGKCCRIYLTLTLQGLRKVDTILHKNDVISSQKQKGIVIYIRRERNQYIWQH